MAPSEDWKPRILKQPVVDDDRVVDSALGQLKGGAEALRPYAGKTVAIVDGEVKASGTWSEVLRQVRELGLVKPIVFFVPAGHVIGARGR